MRLPDEVVNPSSRRLIANLERLRSALRFSHGQWSETLCLSAREYRKLYREKGDIPLKSLLELCDRFNITISSMIEGKIDCAAVAAHHSGNLAYIPEKYRTAAHSRKHTLLNILDHIERLFGWKKRVELLKEFQLSEAAFADLGESINIRLMTDVFEQIGRIGLSAKAVELMGACSVVNKRMAPIRALVSEAKNPAHVYESILNVHIEHFDRNCDYRIESLSSTTCEISARSRDEVLEALKLKELGNVRACEFKVGLVSSFPGLIGLPYAEVRKTACVHTNDSHCRFELEFERAHRLAASGQHPH